RISTAGVATGTRRRGEIAAGDGTVAQCRAGSPAGSRGAGAEGGIQEAARHGIIAYGHAGQPRCVCPTTDCDITAAVGIGAVTDRHGSVGCSAADATRDVGAARAREVVLRLGAIANRHRGRTRCRSAIAAGKAVVAGRLRVETRRGAVGTRSQAVLTKCGAVAAGSLRAIAKGAAAVTARHGIDADRGAVIAGSLCVLANS